MVLAHTQKGPRKRYYDYAKPLKQPGVGAIPHADIESPSGIGILADIRVVAHTELGSQRRCGAVFDCEAHLVLRVISHIEGPSGRAVGPLMCQCLR
jgi:hypothetical protein